VAKRPDLLARAAGPDGKIDPAKALETVNSLMRIGLMRMNRVQEPFIRARNKFGRTPRRRILEAGEKVGKTRIGISEDLAHSFGFRPWLDASDPDYKINIQVPNHGLVGCETMAQSVEAKIRPEFEALIPAHCGPQWKNDTTGALKSITLRYDYLGRQCGSTIHIRSYNQPAESFRGIDPHWNHWDEPPPRDILIASERGKVVTNAPSWFTMTPLKEAYIYDMFSLKAFNGGGSDQEIAVFHGSMWENCQDFCRACDCYIPENDPVNMPDPHQERPGNECPKCRLVMGFIPRAGIEEYLKLFTDPDELAAHVEGKYAHLSGLVYKELNIENHHYQDFKIPEHWMRIEVVDPHDNKPVRWLFGAVSPEDIVINGKTAHRIYWYAYLLPTGSIDDIARKVKVKRAEHNYRTPAFVILDAKYGARSTRTFEGESSWEEDLYKAGIERIRLSHSDPGDVALGHKRVKEYLAPQYSSARGKSVPGMMFAKEGCAGDRGPSQDMRNYQWKPGTDKPEEGYKDFPDCVRYAALEQPVYKAPSAERDILLELLAKKNESDYHPLGYGLRPGVIV
jgi:phage terminase large subunit-like protein